MDEEGFFTSSIAKNDMIVSGGENISAAEVEAVLAIHSDVAEAAVIGVETPDAAGENVLIFISWC